MGSHDEADLTMSGGLAIDLGSSMTRVADADGRLLFEEPTLAAIDLGNDRLIAFGEAAVGLGASSAGRVGVARPVRAGKLVDVELAEAVVAELMREVGVGRMERPEVVFCTHVDTSDVQRRALEHALQKAGCRQIRFLEQPLAVALGAGLDIAEPSGSMVVDFGGGVADIGVMALGGIVTSAAVLAGGSDLDEAVRTHVSRVHGVAIDRRAAESLRRHFGSLQPKDDEAVVEVHGRDVRSGRPAGALISLGEIARALARVVAPIFSAAVRCLTTAPPDLANDLIGAGLVVAGGASRLAGFDRRLASTTGIPVHVEQEPELLAVRGAARCLAGAQQLIPALAAGSGG